MRHEANNREECSYYGTVTRDDNELHNQLQLAKFVLTAAQQLKNRTFSYRKTSIVLRLKRKSSAGSSLTKAVLKEKGAKYNLREAKVKR